jgi:hypothetical protein
MKYFPTGPLPFYFAMATSKRQFEKGCEKLGISPAPDFLCNGAGATMHSFCNTFNNGLVCVVCIDKKSTKEYSDIQIHALLAHEAVHVWQQVKENMGEDAPGHEIEAYTIQWMMQCMAEHLESGK